MGCAAHWACASRARARIPGSAATEVAGKRAHTSPVAGFMESTSSAAVAAGGEENVVAIAAILPEIASLAIRQALSLLARPYGPAVRVFDGDQKQAVRRHRWADGGTVLFLELERDVGGCKPAAADLEQSADHLADHESQK